jgi:hypothetical protein
MWRWVHRRHRASGERCRVHRIVKMMSVCSKNQTLFWLPGNNKKVKVKTIFMLYVHKVGCLLHNLHKIKINNFIWYLK